MFCNAFLILLIVIAVIYDLRERRIPNLLIVIGLITAFLYHIYAGGAGALLGSLKGMTTGIALLFIPFLMNGIGAGDVKLLGMIGAIKGSVFVCSSFLWMAIWGGVIALVILIVQRKLRTTVIRLLQGICMSRLGIAALSESLYRDEMTVYFPYAVAIALGVMSSLVKGWW